MSEIKIWDNSSIMEEACERAEKQLKDMFPDKELTYFDDESDCHRYKEYYQTIFDGLYDDLMSQLPKELSREDNSWIECDDESDVSFKVISDHEFQFMYEENKIMVVNTDILTIKEVEDSLQYSGYSLWDGSIELEPFVIALYRYLFLIDAHGCRD